MDDKIKYIGTEEPEIKYSNTNKKTKKVKKEKFKTNKVNIKLSKFISSTKKSLLSKKVIFLILIVLAIYTFKPITFLKNKLDEKRQYYAQINGDMNISADGIIENIKYCTGIDYYSNCRNTMVYPADGNITCHYDWGHRGIDIACDTPGDTIFSVANGKVIQTGYTQKDKNYVLIQHNINGIDLYLYTFYSNMGKITVSEGEYVYQNTPIGTEGGNLSKPGSFFDEDGHYVHFAVRKNIKESSGLNPNIFLN